MWPDNTWLIIIQKSDTIRYLFQNRDFYLNAPPRPCREPKPPNGEKKSVSVSKSKTFFSNKLSCDMSKNDANGLLEPKNCANVARGSPWNWYVKLFVLLPFVVPVIRKKKNHLTILHVNFDIYDFSCTVPLLPFRPSSPYLSKMSRFFLSDRTS